MPIAILRNPHPAESAKENKAVKQKVRMAFFDRLKGDPQVNQAELKRLLAKESDITGSEQERLFTLDMPQQQPAQPGQPGQPGQPQQGAQPAQAPMNGQIPANADNSQLSQVQQMTQANLPQ